MIFLGGEAQAVSQHSKETPFHQYQLFLAGEFQISFSKLMHERSF